MNATTKFCAFYNEHKSGGVGRCICKGVLGGSYTIVIKMQALFLPTTFLNYVHYGCMQDRLKATPLN